MEIFSELEVLTRVMVIEFDPNLTKVSEVMTTDLVVATEDESYKSCVRKMKQVNCHHLVPDAQKRYQS